MFNRHFKKIIRSFSMTMIVVLLCTITVFAGNNENDSFAQNLNIERPQTYTGDTYQGKVSGKLTWDENRVASFATNENHYIYKYDSNGYRLAKQIKSPDNSLCFWTIKYDWNEQAVQQFEFINDSGYSVTLSALFNDLNEVVGLSDGVDDYFFRLASEGITGLMNSNNELLATLSNNKITSNISKFNDDLLLLAVLTVPAVMGDTLLDYESGIETTPERSSALIVKLPIPNSTMQARADSYQVIVYRYKNKGITANPFGHLDIRFNQYGKHFSYADYEGVANFLIIKNSEQYLSHQSNYQTYEASHLWVSNNPFHSMYTFFSLPIMYCYPSGNFSGDYWKVTSGAYTTYNLLTRNCATIVRDALASGYGAGIMSQYSSNWANLNTPASVFELVRYLERVWV